MKIALFRGGALGDLILTLPVLSALKEGYPGVAIDFFGVFPQATLLRGFGSQEQIFDLQSATLAPLFVRGGRLPAAVLERLRSADLVISYLADPEGVMEGQPLFRSQVICGPYDLNKGTTHAVFQLAEPLSKIGFSLPDPVPRLQKNDFGAGSDPSRIPGQGSGRTIFLHPGSGSQKKNWPIDRWIGLIRAMMKDCRLCVVSGEADRDAFHRLRHEFASSGVQFLDCLPIRELAGHLSQGNLFVGHDSGISHLAAALGVSTIALFGPTDPAIWRPLGDHVRVIKSKTGEMPGIAMEEAFEAARAELARVVR